MNRNSNAPAAILEDFVTSSCLCSIKPAFLRALIISQLLSDGSLGIGRLDFNDEMIFIWDGKAVCLQAFQIKRYRLFNICQHFIMRIALGDTAW